MIRKDPVEIKQMGNKSHIVDKFLLNTPVSRTIFLLIMTVTFSLPCGAL